MNVFDVVGEELKAPPVIHPLAFVDNTVSIGPRTRVWQFASVIRGAVLGADCNVSAGAMLDGAQCGDRCIFGSGVAIGPGFVIGDDVFVGPNVVFCNDRWPATHTQGFDQGTLRSGFVTIRVGDGAAIGANVTLLPGVVIGERAVIAAGVVVERNVPANTLLDRKGGWSTIKDEWRELRMREAPGADSRHPVMGCQRQIT